MKFELKIDFEKQKVAFVEIYKCESLTELEKSQIAENGFEAVKVLLQGQDKLSVTGSIVISLEIEGVKNEKT